MSHPYPLATEQLLHQNYRIVRILGSGGFGVTYLTEHIRLGNRFVIKEYFPSELAQRLPDSSEVLPHAAHRELFERGMRYFFREAQLLHRLKHPNIVPVTDLFEANGTAYFVMPYIGGDTFSDYLRQHPHPNHTKLNNIFLPLLDALEYLHNQRILHRDIKPQNILLAENTPILIDFGAARRFAAGPNTQSSLLFISQGYSPIEQYGGSGKLSPASDLYALSACLYQAVTGKLPPPATDRIGRRLPALADNPDYRARYPQAWLAAVDKGFSLAPPQRFQTVAQMRQALNNAANNGSETAVQPPAPRWQPEKAAAIKPTAKAAEQNKADKDAIKGAMFTVTVVVVILLAIHSGKREEQNSYIAESPMLSAGASDIEGMDNASAVYASDASAISTENSVLSASASDTDISQAEIESLYGQAKDGDTQARERLQELAEQGIADAQNWLGQMYFWGHGIDQDDEQQAMTWYRKAAEQGHASAQNNLAYMYEFGKGVAQDREQAIYWYRQAAQQNDDKETKEKAQTALKRLQSK